MRTDEEIIELYKDGDENAFKWIIEKYTPILFNFISKSIDKENTKDIVQETFIKVWKNLNKFDTHKSSLKTWIFTIARNSTIDFLRKKKSINFSNLIKEDSEEESFSENIKDESPLPMETLEKLEDVKFLEEILQNISEQYRSILLLHYQEEMTFEEIGKVLGKPLNTVKSYHYRALIKLRQMSEGLHQK